MTSHRGFLHHRVSRCLLLTAVAWLWVPARSTALADDIRLKKDGATVTGNVFRLDDDQVVIGIRRGEIDTVNGKSLPAPLVEGSTSPAFAVADILGQPAALGKGTAKVTVLHFWVSWCPHCRSDAPKIQALYDQFHGNPNVRIITVSLDQTREKLNQFVQEHHVTYPVVFASEAASAKNGADLPALYEISGFPVTFLIDDQGVIRRKIRGSFVETRIDLGSVVTSMLSTS